jgi:thiamine-phosphate pyrophosphorylase
MASAPPPAECRLYLITPPRIDDPAAFLRAFEAALSGGDVAALQLRLKAADPLHVAEVVRALKKPCAKAGVALFLNDDPQLAAELYCDGVHVGQSDAPLAEARRIMGSTRMVGVTCHASRDLAYDAAAGGADYVAFGAFFPTATKDAPTRADPEILTIWQETMETPCVAIGGITVETARDVARAGADFLAVSAGVWSHAEGPAAAVEALNREMAQGLASRDALAPAPAGT